MNPNHLHRLVSVFAVCSVAGCRTGDGEDAGKANASAATDTSGTGTGTTGTTDASGTGTTGTGTAGTETSGTGTTGTGTSGTGTTGTGTGATDTTGAETVGHFVDEEACQRYADKAYACDFPFPEFALGGCQRYVSSGNYTPQCEWLAAEYYACLSTLDCDAFNDVHGDNCLDEKAPFLLECLGRSTDR